MLDPSGKKYGRLTGVGKTNKKHRDTYLWSFRCDCGNTLLATAHRVASGNTSSCGCLRTELALANNANRVTHGFARRGKHHPLYKTWEGINARCYDPGVESYKYYGARGITVCDRWRHSFPNFLEDMGERPSSKHSIDRIDVNGDYEPANCRWATSSEQQRNTRRSNQISTTA